MELSKTIEQHYGHRLRQRVCGICLQDNKLLLVQHKGLGKYGTLWSPPGGGLEFGTSASENLEREFLEETGLRVQVDKFLFIHEFLQPPLHALELFFLVSVVGGSLKTGFDPEHAPGAQLIQHVSFLSWEALKKQPSAQIHQILQHTSSFEHLLSMRGYYKFSV